MMFPSDQHATEILEYVVLLSHSDESLNSESLTNKPVIPTSSVSTEKTRSINAAGQQAEVLLRWDIYVIIFGTLSSLIGLALMVLSLLRWKANDLSLISFGILCFLYGARTKAFQFLFDIPLLYWSYTEWFITLRIFALRSSRMIGLSFTPMGSLRRRTRQRHYLAWNA